MTAFLCMAAAVTRSAAGKKPGSCFHSHLIVECVIVSPSLSSVSMSGPSNAGHVGIRENRAAHSCCSGWP